MHFDEALRNSACHYCYTFHLHTRLLSLDQVRKTNFSGFIVQLVAHLNYQGHSELETTVDYVLISQAMTSF